MPADKNVYGSHTTEVLGRAGPKPQDSRRAGLAFRDACLVATLGPPGACCVDEHAHGDFMRMRAERDELEWLLQRGDARAAGTIAKSAAVQMDTEC